MSRVCGFSNVILIQSSAFCSAVAARDLDVVSIKIETQTVVEMFVHYKPNWQDKHVAWLDTKRKMSVAHAYCCRIPARIWSWISLVLCKLCVTLELQSTSAGTASRWGFRPSRREELCQIIHWIVVEGICSNNPCDLSTVLRAVVVNLSRRKIFLAEGKIISFWSWGLSPLATAKLNVFR